MNHKLYLIPMPIAPAQDLFFLHFYKNILDEITLFICENEKTARGVLKKIGIDLASKKYMTVEKQSDMAMYESWKNIINEHTHIGLVSEAGYPSVADPGNDYLTLAHGEDIEVVPLVGPSSIIMALSASGMNGQSFAFHGYLPIKEPMRSKKIKDLEFQSRSTNQTQIFIETPYRNMQLLQALCGNLKNETKLCIATDIGGEHASIKTKPISKWKNIKPHFQKLPTVFLLSSH